MAIFSPFSNNNSPVAIVVVVPSETMNGIFFPITYIHVAIGKIASSLPLPLSINVVTGVDVAIFKSTRPVPMKTIPSPLPRIFSSYESQNKKLCVVSVDIVVIERNSMSVHTNIHTIVKVNSPPSFNESIFELSNIPIAICPIQLTIPMSFPI